MYLRLKTVLVCALILVVGCGENTSSNNSNAPNNPLPDAPVFHLSNIPGEGEIGSLYEDDPNVRREIEATAALSKALISGDIDRANAIISSELITDLEKAGRVVWSEVWSKRQRIKVGDHKIYEFMLAQFPDADLLHTHLDGFEHYTIYGRLCREADNSETPELLNEVSKIWRDLGQRWAPVNRDYHDDMTLCFNLFRRLQIANISGKNSVIPEIIANELKQRIIELLKAVDLTAQDSIFNSNLESVLAIVLTDIKDPEFSKRIWETALENFETKIGPINNLNELPYAYISSPALRLDDITDPFVHRVYEYVRGGGRTRAYPPSMFNAFIVYKVLQEKYGFDIESLNKNGLSLRDRALIDNDEFLMKVFAITER